MSRSYPASEVTSRIAGVGVDWLTVTASSTPAQEELWNVGEQLLVLSQSEGEFPTRWHGHGYEGWCIPHVALGARPDSAYLRLSSHKARDQWQQALAASENCTRIDLAVDVYCNPPAPSVVRDVYRNSLHRRPRNGRPCTSSLTVDSRRGATCYLGRRVSPRFARVYDKGVETKTEAPGRHYRWEVELKAEQARATAASLERSADPTSYVTGLVNTFFRQRSGRGLPIVTETIICNEGAEISTVDRRLQWLARGVRPAVAELIERVGRERVLCALGLLLQSDERRPDR
jgi:DNA relaxase NicK